MAISPQAIQMGIMGATSLINMGSAIGGISKSKKILRSAKDPGAVSKGMGDVVASIGSRAFGQDPILKQQMDAIEAQRANDLAAMREASTSSSGILGAIGAQGAATARAQMGAVAQAGLRKVGAQQAYEEARMGIETAKQQRKMQQYDQTVAQAKEDLKIQKKNLLDAGMDLAATGMKAAPLLAGKGGNVAGAASAATQAAQSVDPNAEYAPSQLG